MDTPDTEDNKVTGVSRSGRIRKKSSKLLDFQSPDESEKRIKRPVRAYSRSSLRGRPSAAVLRERRALEESRMTNDIEEYIDLSNVLSDEYLEANLLDSGFSLHDSEDELDELVADIVEGVEAESLEFANNFNESKVRQSLYMTEKANKRKILKDGKVITEKVERKDKGKSRNTAYSMWSREFRKTSKLCKNQEIDSPTTGRRLGELWANVSNKEKNAWRRKAKLQANKTKAREVAQSNSVSPASSSPYSSRTRKLSSGQKMSSPIYGNKTYESRRNQTTSSRSASYAPSATITSQNNTLNTSNQLIYSKSNKAKKSSVPKIEPIDAAAHLKLLGESLTIIGERLKEHDGQIAVSGSLSVLLDSLLCSLGPLLCLTTHIPGLDNKPKLNENLAAILDNIAYVMPGL